LKKIFYLFLGLILFASCKSKSYIITSKEDAIKKGIYKEPEVIIQPTKVVVEETKEVPRIEPKKKKKHKRDNATAEIAEQNSINKHSILKTENEEDIIVDTSETNYLIEQIINFASEHLGITYRGGGTSKNGFDCSGFMFYCFNKYDILLPRSSYEMAKIGTEINAENARKGDLIFFINRGQRRINHVGMVIENNNNEIKFIHSSTQTGVVISSLNEPYYKKTFKQINRILE